MATPPGTPPTKSSGSKWSARMGGALRRTATVLTAVRPATPAEDGDNRSLKRSSSGTSLSSTAAAQAVAPAVISPSPIAESPVREAAAMEQETLGPSPLARQTTAEEVTTMPESDQAAPPAVEEQTSPTGYVPPPLIDSSAGNPGAFTDDPDKLPQPRTVVDPHMVSEVLTQSTEPIAPEPEQPNILDKPRAEGMKSVESLPVAAEQAVLTAEPQGSSATEPGFSTAVMPSYELPNYNVWAGGSTQNDDKTLMPVPVAAAPSQHSQVSSMKMPNPHVGPHEDPFSDPPAPAPVLAGHSEMPYQPHVSDSRQLAAPENQEDAHPTIVMPLPAFNDVVGQKTARHAASRQSLTGSRTHAEPETDERIPLLARSPLNGYQAPSAMVGPSTSWTTSNPLGRLIDLGWIEYNLPDGTTYYSHMTKKLTTDLNLRSERILNAVTLWTEERENESTGYDMEGWLKESSDKNIKKKKSGWGGRKIKKEDDLIFLERYWVDHHRRSVNKDGEVIGYGRNHAYTNGHGHHGKGKKQAHASKVTEEDHLDSEYRYWAFMEGHPAHLPVSHKAKSEALDVLTWALTDRVLPSHRAIPPPFTQEECQELRGILRSFNPENEQGDNGIQTRIIARILLRVAQWRQMHFRPNKPLPQDIDFGGRALPAANRPFRRAFFDFVISCVCLGIPYFFLERARLAGTRTADEESGLLRGPAPMLIIGACTCLMAAIVLSASVTFLSLPGLDGVTRTAAMVAILFAAFAMAATGVAVLRHKAELGRPVSHVGVEGVVGVSRRTIVLSLPLVFLAYSIVAFISGITLYSFRGKAGDSPSQGVPFDDYTRWIVVGVLGGLAGVVTTSMLLLRH